MKELLNILKDIGSGALPVSEIPGFVLWMFRRAPCFWLLILVVVAAVAVWFVK
jgi:hypothetical protein